MDKREGKYQDFLSKNFCLTVPKKFVGEPSRVSLISGIEKFYAWSLCHDFSSNFFVSQYRKTSQGNHSVLCFGMFPVANKFMDKKGGVSKLSVENFLSHSAKKFRKGTLPCCVSENFRWRKSLWIRGRGKYQDIPSKIFCLTVPENFVGEPFRVSLISGIEKVYVSEGYVTIFRRNFILSHSTETFRRGTLVLLCFG